MAEVGTIVLILAVLVGGALVLAPLKLFPIARTLLDIREELRAIRAALQPGK